MRYLTLLAGLTLAGCNIPPPSYGTSLTAEQQRTCDYAGDSAPHVDDYSGLRARKACMTYVRDTGRMPPGLR